MASTLAGGRSVKRRDLSRLRLRRSRQGDAAQRRVPVGRNARGVHVNELPDAARMRCWRDSSNVRPRAIACFVVKPLAGFVARWWSNWRDRVEQAESPRR